MSSLQIGLIVLLQCFFANADYLSRSQAVQLSLGRGNQLANCKQNNVSCTHGLLGDEPVQKDTKLRSKNHLLEKRSEPAPVDVWINCVPLWNISSYHYDVIVNWTVNGSLMIVVRFRLNSHETDDAGQFYEFDAISIQEPIADVFMYNVTDTHRLPVPDTRFITYQLTVSYNATYSSKPAPECDVDVSAPHPTVVTNISVLSYHFTFTETSLELFVSVEVDDLSLAWTAPIHPNAQLEDLHYEVWVGSDVTVQPEKSDILLLESVHEAENESAVLLSMNLGDLISPFHADFNFTEVYLMMRCFYQVTLRKGNLDSSNVHIYNDSVYSDWSDPVTLPKIVSPPLGILITSHEFVPITASTSVFSTSKSVFSTPISVFSTPTSVFSTPISDKSALLLGIYAGVPLLIMIMALILIVVVLGLLIHKRRKLFMNLTNNQYSGDIELSSMFRGKGTFIDGVNVSLWKSRNGTEDELAMDTFEVPAQCIILEQKLGEGCFGEVYRGIVRGDYSNPHLTAYHSQKSHPYVAVKLLKVNASGAEKRDFVMEIDMMKRIAEAGNPHVVNMLCAVTIQEPLCIVSEFVEHGDLLEYLKACKKQVYHRARNHAVGRSMEGKEKDVVKEMVIYAGLGDVNAADLVSFAYQIASGMEFLSSSMVVHRDLACRNILIGAHKNLKITDFGLARMVANETIYVKTTAGRLPLKWMALESITDREFTIASDVWSFGVVLWEIATLGGFPYPTISNERLLPLLKSGYRMEKPDNCSQEIYQIMLDTWQEMPNDRPTFVDLRSTFDHLLSKQRNAGELYIDLNITSSGLTADLDTCKGNFEELEIEQKLSQKSSHFESVQGEMLKEPSRDSGMENEEHATNPYIDYPIHNPENMTRPINLPLPSQRSSSSILHPLTSPLCESQCLESVSVPLPKAKYLSTSAPNRSPGNSWNAANLPE